jgi:hypothetical protein
MTDEMIGLGRRAVACKGWRWMPGMRTVYMEGGYDYEPGQAFRRTDWLECVEPYKEPRYFHNGNIWYGARDDGLPDFSDPATLGCLLALVRKAWGDPYLCAVGDSDTGWRADAVTAQVRDLHGYFSEAEALVAALESAPALVAAIERLRGALDAERAAVVAWLHDEEYHILALAIERGEHRRKEAP